MRALRAWLTAAAAVAALVLPAGPAQADDAGVLDFSSMSPGSTRTGALTVSNPSDGPATVALAVRDLVDDDGGCVRPEVRAGDTSCGEDGGELSQWLRVAVSHDGDLLWSGPFTDLLEARQLPGTLAPGDSRDLDVTVELPLEAGNDTMTDRTTFDLVVRTVGVAGEEIGEPEVLGAEASTGSQGPGSSAAVPTLVDAGLIAPAMAAAGVLSGNLPEMAFGAVLLLVVALTVRVARRGRGR